MSPWPLIAIHTVLMPDGRVLTYGTDTSTKFDIWDPAQGPGGGHLTLPNTTGLVLFCSSAIALPESSGVFIAGGGGTSDTPNAYSNFVDYVGNSIARKADMNRQRWYSSSITLPDGRTYIQGGTGGEDHPEIRDQNGQFQLLNGADTSGLLFAFPRNFVAPDGRVFGIDGNGFMYYVDTNGNGSVTNLSQVTNPKGRDSSAAMFRPGKILIFGGTSNGSKVIDIASGTPVVTASATLSSQRHWTTAILLADGKVMAIGGSTVKNELTGVNYSAEIWNPNTGQWLRGSDATLPRLYHHTAILLPDASVLVAGGGNPGPLFNDNAEIYYPPYLYDAGGGFAPRPAIEAAPSHVDIGQSFNVRMTSGQGVQRVVMVKTGAVTHSFNMEQRFLELPFQRNLDVLTVEAPARSIDAPPGYYLLFVLNSAGTPSVGRIVAVGASGPPGSNSPPIIGNPGNQSGQAGVGTSLQLSATDANGDAIQYGASGLPPGLAIDPATGLVTGTPTAVGTYNVTAIANDGTNNDSVNFVWTISQTTSSFTLIPPPPPPPALAGAELTLEASAQGGIGLQFKWNFDDGTPETGYSSSPSISHVFAKAGVYYVTVTAIDAGGLEQSSVVVVTVHLPLTANRPAASGPIAIEDRAAGADRLWVVNPDNDSVSAFDTSTNNRLAEIAVGAAPRTVAILPDGEVWVTNKQGSSISVIDSASLSVVRTVSLPSGSQPHGIAVAPTGSAVYVVLEALGRLLKLDPSNGSILASLDVGPNPRHVSVNSAADTVYVSRFITPPLPGESTASVQTQGAGGEVAVVDAATMSLTSVVALRHSDKPDFELQGRGVPNYLGAVAISPDGKSAWVPSKQDNIKRGKLRDNLDLTFENTVRAISSRINLVTGTEDYAARVDHDNASVASAIAYDKFGIYMFVALETSREVAVVDAYGELEIFRFDVGRAPQGLATSPDGRTLYVSNFMDRTVGVYDLSPLLDEGISNVPLLATRGTIGTEKLGAQVLQGKRLFYDARDLRLARDRYLSCASCHNDGGHDGRVWDLTGFGEGLRNTISLRGRAGSQGFLHWSNNFDEVQDFEGQIRALAGGSGLMTNAQFNTGTRSQPLGDKKAGVSADLDALAAYVKSLSAFAPSPLRKTNGSLTTAGVAGRDVYVAKGCASCHGGTAFTNSGSNNPQDIGTITADSGKRLGGTLTGIDVPTLRDVWSTAPYLHLGSAPTLGDAIRAHNNVAVTDSELANLVAYVSQIGNQESSAPGTPPSTTPNTGTGLAGKYFNNKTLTGNPVLQRTEAVNFDWTTNSPGPGVTADSFSVRWTGKVEAPLTGNYTFQTTSNDGVRLWINGVLVVDNWTDHATIANNSPVIALTKNGRYTVTMEFYDNTGAAVARFKWKKPGATAFAAVPALRLYAN